MYSMTSSSRRNTSIKPSRFPSEIVDSVLSRTNGTIGSTGMTGGGPVPVSVGPGPVSSGPKIIRVDSTGKSFQESSKEKYFIRFNRPVTAGGRQVPEASTPPIDKLIPSQSESFCKIKSDVTLSADSADRSRIDLKTELITLLKHVSTSPFLQDEPVITKLIQALSGDKINKWIPYFNKDIYITSDSTCYMESNNHIVLKVGLAGILTSPPIIYPFGDADVKYTFSETDVRFNFSNDDNSYTGVAYGKVSRLNNRYIITLNKFEHKDKIIPWDILQLPLIFTYTGKVS